MFTKFLTAALSFIKNDNPQTQIKWSLYGRVWREFGKPYWKFLLAGVIFTSIAAGAEAFSVTLVKKVIDRGFIEQNIPGLTFIGLQIIGIAIVKGLFNYLKDLVMAKAGLLGITKLRRRIYTHIIKQPMRYFHGTHMGAMMNYFTGLANAVLNLVTDNVISIIHNTATLVMMIGLMVYYAPQMTLILLFLAPAIWIPLIIIMRKKRIVSRNSFGAEAGSMTHISQSLEGVKTIQAFCCEQFEQAKMDKIEDNRINLSFKRTKLNSLQTPILEIMISIGLCFGLLLGGQLISTNTITVGDLAAFLLALMAAYKPAKSITNFNSGIQEGLIAAEGLFRFLDSKHELQESRAGKALEKGPMCIEFENVSFAYNNADGEVLHNISLKVSPGKVCAFVGPSGGGKSTLFNLIARFWDTTQGSVKINGENVREFSLKSLRSNIAQVSQDVFLFNGTIADNIKYGSPTATQEQIEAAAKAANAHQFITSFPSGYHHKIAERGVVLSGGQKQRIAIARAILKDAPILLLDEATSSLDSQSEQFIQSALKKLMQGRTTFVIAHRLSTIMDADIICVIKEGRIVEQGTDAELLSMNGEYAKLKSVKFQEDSENVTENSVCH